MCILQPFCGIGKGVLLPLTIFIGCEDIKFWEHSGNRLNSIIRHYKFNTFIAICLLFNEIFINLGSHIQKNIFIIVFMSDTEIMVILILFHSRGFRCFKHYYTPPPSSSYMPTHD